MRTRLISIFLLFSFLGVFLHDLIPHHHHDACLSEPSHQIHPGNFFVVQKALSLGNSGCNLPLESFQDRHHECPHHYHNCKLRSYELNRSYLSENRSQKQKCSKKYSILTEPTRSGFSLQRKYCTITYQFFAPLKVATGDISKRGPPLKTG